MNPIIESIEETLARIGAKLEATPPRTTVHNALTVLWQQADRLRARAERLALHDVDRMIAAQQEKTACPKTSRNR